MMRIIIYYSDAVHGALVLETAVRSAKIRQRLQRIFALYAQQIRRGDGGYGILDIVVARYL